MMAAGVTVGLISGLAVIVLRLLGVVVVRLSGSPVMILLRVVHGVTCRDIRTAC